MRTIGAKNKPKFIAVSLANLVKTFSGQTLIRVDKAYEPLFNFHGIPICDLEEQIREAKESSDSIIMVPPKPLDLANE
jgi:hypothetical protein